MKKIRLFIIVAIILNVNTVKAQRVLHPSEIKECLTAESVAWNFVNSIIERDWVLMERLMAPLYREELLMDMKNEGLTSYDQVFSPYYIHDIVDMKPLLSVGYQLIITDVYTMVFGSRYSNDVPYKGWNAISVCFTCDRNNSTYENTKYDTTTRIILVQIDGCWRVVGFK